VLIVTLALAAAGCARLMTPPLAPTRTAGDPIAAVRAREQASVGLRLSLKIQGEGPRGALPSVPAFLAVERPDHLRLQVLSLFGSTVLDLEIAGDRFRLRMPLSGTVRRGRIDAAAFARRGSADDERMILALALLFRAKAGAGLCTARGSRDVHCTLAEEVRAVVHLDGAGRPVEERIVHGDGRPLLTATYADYDGTGPAAYPRAIVLRDLEADAAMRIRVVRVRRAGR
jgi:hypothetical protein